MLASEGMSDPPGGGVTTPLLMVTCDGDGFVTTVAELPFTVAPCGDWQFSRTTSLQPWKLKYTLYVVDGLSGVVQYPWTCTPDVVGSHSTSHLFVAVPSGPFRFRPHAEIRTPWLPEFPG